MAYTGRWGFVTKITIAGFYTIVPGLGQISRKQHYVYKNSMGFIMHFAPGNATDLAIHAALCVIVDENLRKSAISRCRAFKGVEAASIKYVVSG